MANEKQGKLSINNKYFQTEQRKSGRKKQKQ